MTTTPDPQTVREIAREIILDDGRRGEVNAVPIGRFGPDTLTKHEYGAWCSAIREAIRAATVTVSWPDEQPQDERGACRAQLPADSAQRLGASPDTTCARPDGHMTHDDGNGVLWADRAHGERDERDGYAVRLLDMLESDPDRFQESEEEDLRAALSALFRRTAEAANLASALAEVTAGLDAANANAAEIADQRTAYREEIMRLRAGQRPALGNAYAAGWTDAIGAIRTPGWAEREAGWKRFLGEADADPETDAKAKFAAEMERLRTNDPDGARWIEHILSERAAPEPELTERQAQLLAAIRREGGDFSPLRARTELLEAGCAVSLERAHQIMKQLAARGYLEPVRPRAYTYRLKTETSQNPEPDRSGT